MLKATSGCVRTVAHVLSAAVSTIVETFRKAFEQTASAVPAPVEMLEQRQLMSGSVALIGGVLTIKGDPSASCNISVHITGSKITGSADHNHVVTYPLTSVRAVNATGGTGNDTFFVDTAFTRPVTITGGGGNDVVRGGGGYNDIVTGDGNDWVSARGTGSYIDVGDGNNTVMGSDGPDTIIAGNGNDLLNGGPGNDLIDAGGGRNSIIGDNGNDTVVAGNGDNTVLGGLGNDKLTVGTGTNIINAGNGSNTVYLGGTKSIVQRSTGTVIVYNAAGTTVATGSGGVSADPTPAANWVSFPAPDPSSPTAPKAVIQLLAPVKVVGIGVSFRGLASTLGVGTPIDADYAWNFGDAGSRFNALHGFNANHVYDSPGTYTITLTVTNNQWQTSTATATVTIAADDRRALYVDSVIGNDSNTGASPDHPIRTAARAQSVLGDHADVLFARGETFDLSSSFLVTRHDVLVGAYGTGPDPVINYTAPGHGSVIFSTNNAASVGVTFQDLTITTLNGTDPTVPNQPFAIRAGGYETTVRRITFKYVSYGVDASGIPTGLSVIDCSSPLAKGMQGYFVWDQGRDAMIVGNYVAGSVHEHVLRGTGITEQLVYGNNFTNHDNKGCIEIHNGTYVWVQGNTVTSGDIRVGPLGLWGETPTSNTTDCVIQGNTLYDTAVNVYPGSHDISIRSNVIHRSSAAMVDIAAPDAEGRFSSDIRIYNNTGVSGGSAGEFLKLEGRVDGVSLVNNLLVEPSLATGGYAAAPVYVYSSSGLSSFTTISNNVWQSPKSIYRFGRGGVNFIGLSYVSSGYLTPASWNNLPQVGNDFFAATPIASTLAPAAGSVAATAGTYLTGVFYDINGKRMASIARWAAGAVQL